jgi:hypothetical protein
MNGKSRNLRGVLGGHVIALVFCVLFPAFVTAVAPVSWIRFEHHGETVSAKTRTCLFFFVPYKSATFDSVVGVRDRFVRGSLEERPGKTEKRRSEDEGFLVIQGSDRHGNDQAVEIPVTPLDIKSVAQRADAFLADPQSTELRLFVVANWKFSVIAGGLVSLLTVLYVAAVVFSLSRALFRGGRWLVRFALARDVAQA